MSSQPKAQPNRKIVNSLTPFDFSVNVNRSNWLIVALATAMTLTNSLTLYDTPTN